MSSLKRKGPVIETPKGKIIKTKAGKAQLRFKLEWKKDFKKRWSSRYSTAQKYVDSEVLRHSDGYVPFRTGMLKKSGILGTDIGSGLVQWIAPYARRQYFSTRKPGSTSPGDPLRGPYWFERMKAIWKDKIVLGARRIAGRGG